jgi:hypothetical protein
MVAEHTCGVDIKSYLRDETAWDRKDFEAARKSDYRFAYTEASWAEQRGYLDRAVGELGDADRALAEAALAQLQPGPETVTGEIADTLAFGDCTVRCDIATGDVTEIAIGGVKLRGASLFGYRYESYDAADVNAHLDSYLTHREEWAILDHAKPGLERAKTAVSKAWAPRLVGVDGATLVMEMPEQAHRLLGAPRRLELAFTQRGERTLEMTLTLRDKPANRMPEASFLHFAPEGARGWEFEKTGLWQPAGRVAGNGGGQLQAVAGVRAEGLERAPLDTPLMGPRD